MQKDFITVTPDSGNGNGSVTVKASQNSGTSKRSSTISITGGGMTRKVAVSQNGRTSVQVIICGSGGYIEKRTI